MTVTEEPGALGHDPAPPGPQRRRRFAGERAGAWLFAASFSVGIWGLALKVLTPDHPVTRAPTPSAFAMIAPSGAPDGAAKVYWLTEDTPAGGYPLAQGAPVIAFDELSGDRKSLM